MSHRVVPFVLLVALAAPALATPTPAGWAITLVDKDGSALGSTSDIEFDEDGVLHAFYARSISGVNSIAYTRKVGPTWTPPVTLDDRAGGLELEVDKAGRASATPPPPTP